MAKKRTSSGGTNTGNPTDTAILIISDFSYYTCICLGGGQQ